MPKQYEAIRDKLKRQGTPIRQARRSAARIYNSQRKPGVKPVTRGRD